MKNILLYTFIFLMTIIFPACAKEDPKPDCETNSYAIVTVSNSSSNPYDVYVDNNFTIRLQGGQMAELKVKQGNNRKLYAVQVSGYIFYPTEKTTYANIIQCSDYGWQIP